MIKVLKDGYDLSAVGNVDAPLPEVIAQATHFISACYGMKESRDMSHIGLLVWGKKQERSLISQRLPYHLQIIENVKRAHFQAALWRSISVNPELSPEENGWDTANKTLCLTSLPDNTKPAPDYILEIIKCGCKTDTPCSTKKINTVVGSKDYLAPRFVHVLVWGV